MGDSVFGKIFELVNKGYEIEFTNHPSFTKIVRIAMKKRPIYYSFDV